MAWSRKSTHLLSAYSRRCFTVLLVGLNITVTSTHVSSLMSTYCAALCFTNERLLLVNRRSERLRAVLDAEADTGGPPNPQTQSNAFRMSVGQQGLDAASSAARREGLWELSLLTHHTHTPIAAAAAELRKSLTEGKASYWAASRYQPDTRLPQACQYDWTPAMNASRKRASLYLKTATCQATIDIDALSCLGKLAPSTTHLSVNFCGRALLIDYQKLVCISRRGQQHGGQQVPVCARRSCCCGSCLRIQGCC